MIYTTNYYCRIKLTYTDEEMIINAAIAKKYQIESAKRHNLLSKDVTTKIWLQQQAIKALPSELLRVHALTIDNTPAPEGRPFPHWYCIYCHYHIYVCTIAAAAAAPSEPVVTSNTTSIITHHHHYLTTTTSTTI